MRFHSKIDVWFVVLTAAMGAAVCGSLLPLLVSGLPGAAFIVAGVTAFALALPIWLLVATHYTFLDGDLLIRSGPFRWKVPLGQVRGVSVSRSRLSGPALSLDRLLIQYGRGESIVVSPADKAGFIRELEARRSNNSPERSRDRDRSRDR